MDPILSTILSNVCFFISGLTLGFTIKQFRMMRELREEIKVFKSTCPDFVPRRRDS